MLPPSSVLPAHPLPSSPPPFVPRAYRIAAKVIHQARVPRLEVPPVPQLHLDQHTARGAVVPVVQRPRDPAREHRQEERGRVEPVGAPPSSRAPPRDDRVAQPVRERGHDGVELVVEHAVHNEGERRGEGMVALLEEGAPDRSSAAAAHRRLAVEEEEAGVDEVLPPEHRIGVRSALPPPQQPLQPTAAGSHLLAERRSRRRIAIVVVVVVFVIVDGCLLRRRRDDGGATIGGPTLPSLRPRNVEDALGARRSISAGRRRGGIDVDAVVVGRCPRLRLPPPPPRRRRHGGRRRRSGVVVVVIVALVRRRVEGGGDRIVEPRRPPRRRHCRRLHSRISGKCRWGGEVGGKIRGVFQRPMFWDVVATVRLTSIHHPQIEGTWAEYHSTKLDIFLSADFITKNSPTSAKCRRIASEVYMWNMTPVLKHEH